MQLIAARRLCAPAKERRYYEKPLQQASDKSRRFSFGANSGICGRQSRASGSLHRSWSKAFDTGNFLKAERTWQKAQTDFSKSGTLMKN